MTRPQRPVVVPVPELYSDLVEMKIRQIRGGLAIAVNNEEEELVKRIEEGGITDRDALSEREVEMARSLVSRGVLNKSFKDGKVLFRFNDLEDVWRD